jgi:hypothetical protein
MAIHDNKTEWSINLARKIARCNYQYGHVLVCLAQGRITDAVALEKRFDALEEKILGLVEEMDHTGELEVIFDRKLIPPAGIYLNDYPFTHFPFFPLKFLLGQRDVSSMFQIELEDDQ